MAKTLNDFQVQYDRASQTAAKIDAALKSLGDAWEYPLEFAQRAGIAARLLSQNADKYKAHVVTLPRGRNTSQAKVAWAGTPKFATLLRQQLAKK